MTEHELLLRPLLALVGGGLIGLERSFHGRAAGLRTYALVSFASALLVGIAQFMDSALPGGNTNVARVIQGIVTGIGFLGAGVIVKEGFTVRGLTTAASVWVVSAIGVAFGAGFLLEGAAAVVLTLAALSLLRVVEDKLHVQLYVHCHVAFRRKERRDEAWLRAFVKEHGFAITDLSYRLDGRADLFEYQMVMWSLDKDAVPGLGRALLEDEAVSDFTISPSRD
ncbi:MAG TPA: MgtC/SapB family protein [Casimicrobiaceae bacterium]|nr:MgtC/SapB family protein [Casimicrobiaceae bacterium]